MVLRKENKRRHSDETRSDHAHKMLERVFYGPETVGYHGVYDKETQVKGVDSIFSYNGKEYYCDEKAAVNYVAKGLHTFSLELTFTDRANKTVTGWLLKEDNTTDSYIFMWFDEYDYEIALVEKSKIIEYLNSLGWDKDKLLKKADLIRKGDGGYLGNIMKNGCRFSFSNYDWMPEKPINVLVPREKLVNMAVFYKKFKYEEEDKIIFGLK